MRVVAERWRNIFADIFTISCGKLQNFVENFLQLCAGSFKVSLRTVSQFYFLTKYYVALQIILGNSERKGHGHEDNIKIVFKQGLKIYSGGKWLGTTSIGEILLNARSIRCT
jgi:hypothetical protein